jgi:hypothetical protein
MGRSELDLDILTVYARRIRPHRASAGRTEKLARGDAEFCSVPGTDHNILFDLALGQRSAPVIAGVIYDVITAVNVEEGQTPTRQIYALGLAGG